MSALPQNEPTRIAVRWLWGQSPRYVVTAPGPLGLRRVVRWDGRPLRTVALPVPPPWVPPPVPPPPAFSDQPVVLAASRVGYVADVPVSTAAEMLAYRHERGWSQYELSQRLGWSRSIVAAVEAGSRPGAEVLRSMGRLMARVARETEGQP